MSEAFKIPPVMDVAEFLDWDAPEPDLWQLVDGEPRAMAPASLTHNGISMELGRLIGNHLVARGGPCRIIAVPGVIPRVRSDRNFRIPDLGVTCSPQPLDGYDLPDPVLLIEILSPSNQTETWNNVWTYTTIPSVQEILVLRTSSIRADLLRRRPDGTWPEVPETIAGGTLALESIGFQVELTALYRGTRLAVG
jgi:Uma2 family endonuclease